MKRCLVCDASIHRDVHAVKYDNHYIIYSGKADAPTASYIHANECAGHYFDRNTINLLSNEKNTFCSINSDFFQSRQDIVIDDFYIILYKMERTSK